MREIDELRPLTAGRLLDIWRESRREAEEETERALLCNAQVLAESCRLRGEPVFLDGRAVLEALTPREMEVLLRRLCTGDGPPGGAGVPDGENPAFDPARFRALEEG